MRIRTQLIVTVLLFGFVLAGIAASAIITGELANRSSSQEAIASSVAQGANELSYLANDYVMYGESQQLSRWQTRYLAFSEDVASLRPHNAQQRALASGIQANTQRMKDVFDSIAAPAGSSGGQSAAVDVASLQVSWSRMGVQSQSLSSDANRLAQLLRSETDGLKQTNMVVIFVMVAVFGIYFAANYVLIQRRVLTSISVLQASTDVIGSGDLGFKVKEASNDEVGDLSRSFNRMTANLREVTASKTELERQIEERRKAEDAQKESENKYRELFDTANDIVYSLDLEGNVRAINRAVEHILGYSPEEVVDKPIAQFFTPGAIDMMREQLAHKISGQAVTTYELVATSKNGLPVSLEINSRVVYKNGVADGISGIARDVTERRQAEEALREREKEYRSLAENIPDVVTRYDRDLRHVFVNTAASNATGMPPEAFIGKTNLELGMDQAQVEFWMKRVRSVFATGKPETMEFQWEAPDGLRYQQTVITPEFSSDGSVKTVLCVTHNLTELKRNEVALRKYTRELEAANKELEAFSYSVSHDLRAPLRSMEGFSGALLEDYADKLDDQGKKYLGYVQDASEVMGQLIDDLLKLARVSRTDMNYETVDLSDLAKKAVTSLELAEPGRKVRTSVAPDISAYGDRNLLRLALDNLIGNAWKFTGKTAAALIEVGTSEYNGKKAFYVRDNGVGFDMTYADKLFKPFQRLHSATDFPGTGIGLATVQRVINRHGGEVWAEGEVGLGATFYFTLGHGEQDDER